MWLPLQWNIELVAQVQHDGLVTNAPGFEGLINEFETIQFYSIVYNKVVALTVYFYFSVGLIGAQWLVDDEFARFYPYFLTVKFLFLFG